MATPRCRVIVNLTAGVRSTAKKWPGIKRLLRDGGLGFDVDFTEGVGHAIQLAATAAGQGYELVVAVGGDGTANEVANGLLASGGEATLGYIATGTGSDFRRSLGLPKDLRQACLRLGSPRAVVMDVGAIEYMAGGERVKRYLINQAGLGFDGVVVEATPRVRLLGGTVPYLVGLVRTLLSYGNKDVLIDLDGRALRMRACSIVVANGSYFGGGMHVAPHADLRDGLFDVVVVGDVGRLELVLALPKVYKGTHLEHPKVSWERAAVVRVEASQRMLLQVDGELVGEAPASFSIVPGALRVAV